MDIIEKYRKRIDLIDSDIVTLLNYRYDACLKIGEEKAKHPDRDVYDPDRESKLMEKLRELEKYKGSVDAIWPTIMNFSKELQKKMREN